MRKQPEPLAEFTPDAPETAVVSLKIAGGGLSPEQTRFNKLVARVETLTHEIVAAQALGDAHRLVFMKAIPPLESRCSELMREMILFLHQRLQQKTHKAFTERDRQLMRELVCSLAISFAQSGDAVMQAIFDAHSDQSLDEMEQEDAAEVQAMFDDVLKGDAPKLDPLATAEEILLAGAKRLRELEEAQIDKRNARQSKREKSARDLKGGEPQDDPETVLRTLYRQLASKLHPDRARDPVARKRKNALMSQANTAYEKRDLMTLLKLQLTVEQLESESIAGMAKEKMAAFTHLLKEQVRALESDLINTHGQLAQEFGLSPFSAFDAISLARNLKEQRAELQAQVSKMEYDFNRVSNNESEMKRWLKEQRKLMKHAREMSGTFGML